MNKTYDYIVIGAGIVGLATALNLLTNDPTRKILVLEKEAKLGVHQTGNNSGVIHSGIYYKPKSAKALNCVRGYKLLIDYCNKHEIKYDLCGKLIVATTKEEEYSLNEIHQRGEENGLENLIILSSEEIKAREPHVKGTKAIYVPQTGIIDFLTVLKSYATSIKKLGGTIHLSSTVQKLIEKNDFVEVLSQNETFTGKRVICCAGLNSDRLALNSAKDLDLRIIPFKGEYYKVRENKKDLVNGLIYPVPDPSFPFLGVHFTKKINGEIEAGPNAVLSFAREGYHKFAFNAKDTIDTFAWPGFRKIARKYWKTGFGEFYRSLNKIAFTQALQKLVPAIRKDDLITGGAGIRAQACDKNGYLLDDFKFIKTKRILHVCNAPSPAATASLAIGEQISQMITN